MFKRTPKVHYRWQLITQALSEGGCCLEEDIVAFESGGDDLPLKVKSRFEYGRFLLPAMTRDMRYKVQDKGAEGLRELSWTFHRPCGCCGGLVRERIMLVQTSGRLRIVGTFRRCVCVAGATRRCTWRRTYSVALARGPPLQDLTLESFTSLPALILPSS